MEDEWVTAKTRTYAWGLDIQGSLQGAAGVGGLVAVHDKIENPSGKLLLPGYDANGNVAVMVNGTNGDLEAAYEYGPFGESLRQEGPSAKVNPFRFSTKYTDDETGLNYYGRRYYDPRNGRFLGRDPLGEAGGINLYGFVANNTVNTWDYLGMDPEETEWTIVDEKRQNRRNEDGGGEMKRDRLKEMKRDRFNTTFFIDNPLRIAGASLQFGAWVADQGEAVARNGREFAAENLKRIDDYSNGRFADEFWPRK